MIPVRKATEKIIFAGKGRLDSNKCLSFAMPVEESKRLDPNAEYLIIIEGPINGKRTANNRIVISL